MALHPSYLNCGPAATDRKSRHRRLAAVPLRLDAVPKGAAVADTVSAARAMWTMFEPVHDVTYFAPEALSAFTEAGLRGYWRGYFAGRAAPLGGARAAVVTASFYNFAPAFVARAIPGVWDLVTPHEA